MSKKNILIIDDSNTNLVLLESLFRRNGYRVNSALSAREGIECLKDTAPDLIYLDLRMPEVDGFQFIEILQKNIEWKNIPVVILSAVSDRDTITRSIELGVVDYLTKPLDIEKVISLTRSILSN